MRDLKALTKNQRIQKLVQNIVLKFSDCRTTLENGFDNLINKLNTFQQPKIQIYEGPIEYEDFSEGDVDEGYQAPTFNSNRGIMADKSFSTK